MRLLTIALVALMGMARPAVAEDAVEWSDCAGIVENDDGSFTFPSPMSANVECFPEHRMTPDLHH